MNLGSGDGGEFTFIDIVGIISFLVGLQNLDLNITQEDFQRMMQDIDQKTERLLSEIHAHLENQDKKIDEILKRLEKKRNEKS